MKRIFFLGNATVDLTLVLPVWPSSGETVLASSHARGPGGKGLNQAWAAARAGSNVILAAPIGEDDNGTYLTNFAKDTALFEARWRMCTARTDISTIWVDGNGENMIVSSADCARTIGPDEVDALLAGFSAGDLLVLQGNLKADTTIAACRYAVARGGRTILNTAPIDWSMTSLLNLVDVVICNQPEAAMMSGREGQDAAVALSKMVRGSVIVTLGKNGAVLIENEGPVHLTAPAVTAHDTSGAGDVAVGFIAATLARGGSLTEAANVAIKAASLSVTRLGTLSSCPTLDEVASFSVVPEHHGVPGPT